MSVTMEETKGKKHQNLRLWVFLDKKDFCVLEQHLWTCGQLEGGGESKDMWFKVFVIGEEDHDDASAVVLGMFLSCSI